MTNKVIFITGSTKGIGYGMAEFLLKEGHSVVVTGRKESNAKEAANKLSAISKNVLGLEVNVKDINSLQSAIKATLDTFGKIDVVVANAGLGVFRPVDQLTIEEWDDMIDTNLSGAFYTLKASVNALKASEGYYISISSLAGTNFFENGSGYNASKFGVVGFTQAAMIDLRKHNIKAITIMPGSVASYFNGHVPNEKDGWKIQPEDLGQLVGDILRMNPRALPSKIEIRPSRPDLKK